MEILFATWSAMQNLRRIWHVFFEGSRISFLANGTFWDVIALSFSFWIQMCSTHNRNQNVNLFGNLSGYINITGSGSLPGKRNRRCSFASLQADLSFEAYIPGAGHYVIDLNGIWHVIAIRWHVDETTGGDVTESSMELHLMGKESFYIVWALNSWYVCLNVLCFQ